MTKIGNKVRVLRERRNLSKAQLAEALGVTAPAIHHIERGIRKPSATTMVKLADFFDVSVEVLVRAYVDETADDKVAA